MSRTRKVIGLSIMVILYAIIIPLTFSLICDIIDAYMKFAPILPTLSDGTIIIIAAAVILLGLFWILWAYSYLHFIGKGTPVEVFGIALHPTENLVKTGPYAYTRNPMMLGFIIFILGIALYKRSLSGIVLVPIILILELLYIKYVEEVNLVKRFGNEYIEYRKTVPPLFPKLRM